MSKQQYQCVHCKEINTAEAWGYATKKVLLYPPGVKLQPIKGCLDFELYYCPNCLYNMSGVEFREQEMSRSFAARLRQYAKEEKVHPSAVIITAQNYSFCPPEWKYNFGFTFFDWTRLAKLLYRYRRFCFYVTSKKGRWEEFRRDVFTDGTIAIHQIDPQGKVRIFRDNVIVRERLNYGRDIAPLFLHQVIIDACEYIGYDDVSVKEQLLGWIHSACDLKDPFNKKEQKAFFKINRDIKEQDFELSKKERVYHVS